MAAILRAREPGPVVLLGHSIGGHVGALLAGAHPGAIDALALVACGTPYWRCFPGRAGPQVLALAWIARVSSAVAGYYPGERIGFAGREAAQLMSEWSSLARRGRFDVAGLDAERVLAAARVPVLAIRIPGDDKAPAAAVQHLTGKLSACDPVVVAIEPSRLDPRAHDHIRWVRDAAPVADVVARWVRAR
jgi:predicted alpha/beta hydrolase